jgi:ribose-phosphate pyrophosphokinase
MVLSLDKNFQPFQGEAQIEFESFTFSGGEPHIKILSGLATTDNVIITHRLNSFNDIGLLCLAVDALKRIGVKTLKLFIPYFPAARQDRVMVNGEPLSVKIYADIINSLGCSSVMIFDPHSEVTQALINNCVVVTNHRFIEKVIVEINNQVKLISPDGGALKKIYKVSEFLGGIDVVECSKSRDVKTGSLFGFKVYDDNLNGSDCLIVDDICDGGGTFLGLAEELKKKNAGKLYLAVSHGIFSKGCDSLLACFSKIYVTDSIKEMTNKNLKQIKFSDGLLS